MTVDLEEQIRAAVRAERDSGKGTSKGKARYALNLWKGEQRRALDAEYNRRLAEIDAMDEDDVQEGVDVLALVAQARAVGISRTRLRIALGKSSMAEVDSVIARAREHFAEQMEAGSAQAFTLRDTGKVHAKGWPMYAVTVHETGETHEAVYLVINGEGPAQRRHLRIYPAPAGSQEILESLDALGVTTEMFSRGKE